MATRRQVDELAQPRLRPAASPVDTFVQPSTGSGLSQLAKGLSTIAPSLARFSEQQHKVDSKKNFEAGKAKAQELRLEAKEIAKLVKEGKIPEAANPWFRAGLLEQTGQVAASQFGNLLDNALFTDPALVNSTNVSDFEAYVTKKRDEFLDAQTDSDKADRFFQAGFGDMAEARIQNAGRQFATMVSQRISAKNDDLLAARAADVVTQGVKGGLTHEQIAADITAILDEQHELNPSGAKRAHDAVVEGVIRYARANKDPEILREVIAKTMTGEAGRNGGRLTLDKFGRGAEAVSQIADEIATAKVHQWEVEAKIEGRPIMEDFMESFLAAEDPVSFDVEPFTRQMAAVDRSAVASIRQFKTDWVNSQFEGNPAVEAHYFTRVFEHGDVTMGQLAEAYSGTRQISKQTFTFLAQEIQQQRAAAREGRTRGLLGSDPDYQKVYDAIYRSFVTEAGQSAQDQKLRAPVAASIVAMEYAKLKAQGKFTSAPELTAWIMEKIPEALIKYNDEISAMFSGMTAQELSKTIAAGRQPGAPKHDDPADWRNESVITRGQLGGMELQVKEMQEGKRKSLGESFKKILRDNNIRTPEEFTEFLKTQKKLITQ